MSEAIGTREFAEKYGVTQATVSKWCREGKIPNCNQDGKGSPWHIPKDAVPPVGYNRRKKWYLKGAAYGSRTIQSTVLFRKLLPNYLHSINLCTDILASSAGGRLFAGCSPTYIPEIGSGIVSLLYRSVWRGRTFLWGTDLSAGRGRLCVHRLPKSVQPFYIWQSLVSPMVPFLCTVPSWSPESKVRKITALDSVFVFFFYMIYFYTYIMYTHTFFEFSIFQIYTKFKVGKI